MLLGFFCYWALLPKMGINNLKLKLYSLISNLNHTATHYSLISNSLFSHGSNPSSLSSLMAEDPWSNPIVEDPKTHSRNPRLSSLSLSLSLSLSQSRALSLLSWPIHFMAEDLWPNPMVENPET